MAAAWSNEARCVTLVDSLRGMLTMKKLIESVGLGQAGAAISVNKGFALSA